MSQAATELETELGGVISLLGGDTIFDQPFRTALEAHEHIQRGFPTQSLIEFVSHFPLIARGDALVKVLGMNVRTFHRRKKPAPTSGSARSRAGVSTRRRR